MSDCVKRILIVGLYVGLGALATSGPWAQSAEEQLHQTDKAKLDSIEKALPFVEDKVMSTLLFGGSAPVSFMGEARLKGTYHLFTEDPPYFGPHLRSDASATDSVCGDRSALLPTGGVRLGMVVQPARNLALWSKLGFSSKFVGNQMRSLDTVNGGFSVDQAHYYSANNPVAIFEDMAGGIAVMTTPVSFWVKMGSIIWAEASPLTLWKSEPRAFAWEYLEYEDESSSEEYYKNNVAIGEKTGRAAWNKKAFNGINLESINLPLDFYVDLLYAKFPDYDPFEREYMDFSGDLGYASEEARPAIIQTGYGDSYRHAMHARVAKPFGGLTLGLNYTGINVSDDIIYAQGPYGIFFNSAFNLEYKNGNPMWATTYAFRDSLGRPIGVGPQLPAGYVGRHDSTALDCGRGFYKQPHAFSIDLKGTIGPHFSLQSDLGLSRVDTTWVYGDTVTTTREGVPLTVQKRTQSWSDFYPGFYTTFGYDEKKIEANIDVAYLKKGFYSPFSFINPMDAFFAFGSNTVGEGTFSAKTEASPYCQNMAGIQLHVAPKLPGDGHIIVKYGQHFQPEPGRDILFFPYRLNGMDVTSFITSSYNLDGLGTVDYPMTGVKYDRRLGDESYNPQLDLKGNANDYAGLEEGPEKGGLRSDYLSMYEGFVPYDDPQQVLLNIACQRGIIARARQLNPQTLGKVIQDNGDTVEMAISSAVSDENGFVPTHKKYTSNLELDAAYDIGPMIHFKNKCYLAGYAAIEGVSTAFRALDVGDNDDKMLLWSMYYRFEPAIELTPGFIVDLLLGWENWRSNKAWMNLAVDTVNNVGKEDLNNPIIKRVPIDYRDVACGIGFDWDIVARTSLHFRCKWLKHGDEQFTRNDYEAFLTSLEITSFF